MGRFGTVYCPPGDVSVPYVTPVLAFRIMTFTLGTTAPLLSSVVPVNVPRSNCADNGPAIRRTANIVINGDSFIDSPLVNFRHYSPIRIFPNVYQPSGSLPAIASFTFGCPVSGSSSATPNSYSPARWS